MDIVSKAHRRSALILRAFTSQDVKLLICAYIVYVRPLLEHNTVIWTPYFVKDLKLLSAFSGALLNDCEDMETTRMQNGCTFFNCTVWKWGV